MTERLASVMCACLNPIAGRVPPWPAEYPKGSVDVLTPAGGAFFRQRIKADRGNAVADNCVSFMLDHRDPAV